MDVFCVLHRDQAATCGHASEPGLDTVPGYIVVRLKTLGQWRTFGAPNYLDMSASHAPGRCNSTAPATGTGYCRGLGENLKARRPESPPMLAYEYDEIVSIAAHTAQY